MEFNTLTSFRASWTSINFYGTSLQHHNSNIPREGPRALERDVHVVLNTLRTWSHVITLFITYLGT
jgi:hypothetical protein